MAAWGEGWIPEEHRDSGGDYRRVYQACGDSFMAIYIHVKTGHVVDFIFFEDLVIHF